MPPQKNFLQPIDFTGLTCILFRGMDLSLFFGLNSRFGAVWGRDWWSYALGSFPLAEQLGLSKSTGLRFSAFLEDSAPALPVSQSVLHGLGCASVIEVTGWCDEKPQSGLVWGIPLFVFEKRAADNHKLWGCTGQLC